MNEKLHQFEDKIIIEQEFNALYQKYRYEDLTICCYLPNEHNMYKLFVLVDENEVRSLWKYIGMSYSLTNGETAMRSFMNLNIGNNQKTYHKIKEMLT